MSNEQKQFEIINRAKVRCDVPQSSRVDGGRLPLINVGNFKAEELEIIYKITQIDGGKEVVEKAPVRSHCGNLNPIEIFPVSYKSDFKNEDRNIFMIAVWQYKRRIIWNSTDEKLCSKCGEKVTWDDFTVDHIDPFSKGGRTRLDNATIMCRSCNSADGNRK